MGRLFRTIYAVVVSLVLYAFMVPVENFDPQVDVIPAAKEYASSLYDEKFVKHIKGYRNPELQYPEDLEVDEKTGFIYTGLKNGSILQISGQGLKIIGQVKGYPIGSKLRGEWLYFIDLPTGPSRLNLKTGDIQVLTDNYQGQPFSVPDNFDVAKDGKVYFSDASTKYKLDDFMLDMLEGKPYGRLYVWDPATKETTLLLNGLYFSNGVEVAPNHQSVFVSESNACRVIEYFLEGPKKGKTEIVVDNLPGFPDNIKFNDKGELWVAIPVFRDALTENVLVYKSVRSAIAHLPSSVHALLINKGYVGGLKVDVNARKVVKILKSTDTSKIFFVTTILEKKGRLYFGSLLSDSLGVLPLPEEQLSAGQGQDEQENAASSEHPSEEIVNQQQISKPAAEENPSTEQPTSQQGSTPESAAQQSAPAAQKECCQIEKAQNTDCSCGKSNEQQAAEQQTASNQDTASNQRAASAPSESSIETQTEVSVEVPSEASPGSPDQPAAPIGTPSEPQPQTQSL